MDRCFVIVDAEVAAQQEQSAEFLQDILDTQTSAEIMIH